MVLRHEVCLKVRSGKFNCKKELAFCNKNSLKLSKLLDIFKEVKQI